MTNTRLFATVLVGLSAASAPRPAIGAGFVQDRFAIGFWVDPPMDERGDQRYREIAEANFTLVIGGFGARTPEQVTRQVALCEKYNLRCLIKRAWSDPKQFPDSAAVWGYMIRDEPPAGNFAQLRKQCDAIRKVRPGKICYINLLPNYANAKQLGTKTYEEHVRRFVDEVEPAVLSMDHYPYMKPERDTRDAYCKNLEVLRVEALRKGIPFWNFFNTMPFGPHLDPTEAQLRWQIFTSIAYGAKGVLWFCYYTPLSHEFPKGGAIIRRDGLRTRHYDHARRINAMVRNLGPTLMKLTSTGVQRVPRDADATKLPAGTGINAITKGNYLIGTFQHADGRRAVMLNNYDFAFVAWPTVAFDAPHEKVVEVCPKTGKEVPLLDDSPNMEGMQLSIDAGMGRLFLLPGK